MATLKLPQTMNRQSHILTMAIHQQGLLEVLSLQAQQQRKWLYVIADNLRGHNLPYFSIMVRKPANGEMINWLEKIVTGGQAGIIVVQDLNLDEMSHQRLKTLCQRFDVTVINLQQHPTGQLIKGPWTTYR